MDETWISQEAFDKYEANEISDDDFIDEIAKRISSDPVGILQHIRITKHKRGIFFLVHGSDHIKQKMWTKSKPELGPPGGKIISSKAQQPFTIIIQRSLYESEGRIEDNKKRVKAGKTPYCHTYWKAWFKDMSTLIGRGSCRESAIGKLIKLRGEWFDVEQAHDDDSDTIDNRDTIFPPPVGIGI